MRDPVETEYESGLDRPTAEEIEKQYEEFAVPEDPIFSLPEMQIRHAIAIPSHEKKSSAEMVALLEEHASRWGLVRHGKLSFETWNHGRCMGIGSHFRIVDIRKFVDETVRLAK